MTSMIYSPHVIMTTEENTLEKFKKGCHLFLDHNMALGAEIEGGEGVKMATAHLTHASIEIATRFDQEITLSI